MSAKSLMKAAVGVCVLFLAISAHAGTCPATTNYLSADGTSLVTLASLGVTQCFYIAANGLDSATGADEAHPWLHAPGMPNCASSCLSHTVTAGDGFIFRGGADCWHFGESSGGTCTANSYVGSAGWSWSAVGSSGSPIYIGVDQTWFSGASWARPVWTADNPTSASTVGSCPAPFLPGGSSNTMFSTGATAFIILDNFEVTGFCWNSNTTFGANTMISLQGNSTTPANNPLTVENFYFHGWTHTSAGTQGGGNAGAGIAAYNGAVGLIVDHTVFDGSDTDELSLLALGNGRDLYILRYSVFRFMGGNNDGISHCHHIHDNLFEHLNNVTDGSTHSDMLQCVPSYNGGAGNPNLFYNNIVRFIGTDFSQALSAIFQHDVPAGQVDYDFNNVYHDIDAGSNYIVIDDPNSPTNTGTVTFYNDTAVLGGSSCVVCVAIGTMVGNVVAKNNHWIGSPATQASFFNQPSQASETFATYMLPTTATGQDYTSANDFAPTLNTNSTVAAGSNNASFCNGLSDATAKSSCLNGTTLGCQYVSATHSVNCPGIPGVPRPSVGVWDTGAYEFQTPSGSVFSGKSSFGGKTTVK